MRVRILYKLSVICCAVMVLYGCSATKTAAPQLSPDQIEINNSIVSGNPFKIMDSYFRYEEHRDFIADYLLSEVGYSDYTYSELEHFAQYAKRDTTLYEGYNFIIKQRENQVRDHIATLTLPAMAEYYINNTDERVFLRPLLQKSLISTLADKEYPFIREVHKSFTGSDLSHQIDSIYQIKRAEILPKVIKMVDQHCAVERQLLSQMQSSAMSDIATYLERGLPIVLEDGLDKINRGILDEILTREATDSLSIREYFEYKVGEVLNQEHIANQIFGAANDFKQSIDSCRANIAEQLLLDYTADKKLGLQQSYSAEDYQLLPLDWQPIEKIEQIKSKIDWVSWGLTIVSLIPGVGIAADAADLIYGLWSESDKSKGINEQLETFATQIGKVLNKSITDNTTALFDTLNSDLLSTQDSFKQYIYENF